ncbi:hypothetical protein [uncultured Erythrobacter sp.]|uniref:hypothetical protein n=1 Tax=uncultured Erythrobacter sp. TaxID=263913 RepID=UPI002616B05F|nr:hypothetical protein [uncultured Erythrobacter sp.]
MKDLTNKETSEVSGGIIGLVIAYIAEKTGGNERAKEFREKTGDSMFGSGNMK